MRLRTSGGLSEYHASSSAVPDVEENEIPQRQRNDKRETATAVPANHGLRPPQ
jgi:hypothetical protein